MSNVLTFDLGTTYFKACLFDNGGRLLALARCDTPVTQPHEGWYEINSRAFLDAVIQLAAEVRSQAPSDFAGASRVSFATQTNSFLLLGHHDEPLTPIILWTDRRAASLADLAAEISSDSALRRETGVPEVGTRFALLKVLWLRRHEPTLWRSAARFCLISDFLTHWFTGHHVTEGGAAGLTGMLNIHTMRWRMSLLSKLDLDRLLLPEPRYAGADVGPLRPEVAEQLGLAGDCRLILGCLDQYAGAIGAGNVEPGGVSETTGTVLATIALSDRFDADLSPSVFQGPAWRRGLWWRMSFGSISANLLEALRRSEPDTPSYEALNDEAAAVAAGADGVQLDTARSLAADRPLFSGLDTRHGRGHRVRAIFEAVAASLRDQAEHLGGVPRERPIRSVGGAARSRLWLQIKADALGAPVQPVECPEPTSLGAAILAVSAARGEEPNRTAAELVTVAPIIHPR